MILNTEVEVKLNGQNIKHYEKLGYQIPMKKSSKLYFAHTGKEFVYDTKKTIMVKVSDLPNKSNVSLNVLCDMCKKQIMSVRYADYNRVLNKTGSYVCKKCSYIKTKQTQITRYGDFYVKTNEFKNKKNKRCLDEYGYENPMQSPEVKARANKTLCANGTQKTSQQQLYLHNLYGGKLNYPIVYYSADICLLGEKIVIEYDGGGHDLRVTLGRLTQEEFNQKELIRNNIIKREGFKQMRIVSSKDLLPTDQILLQMLDYSRNYFSKYPNHSWIEWNIDTSTVQNAEQKDGVFFDYGDLRKIKNNQ